MKQTAFTVLAAGAFATIAFDAFGQGLAPMFGYAKLAPVGLANQTLNTVFENVPKGSAHLLHVMTGMVFYTLGYLMVARPIQKVVLWIFALYVMAHLVAGNKPFLGFTGITWVALWGHIVFALVAAWIMEARGAVFNWAKPQPAIA